MDKPRTIVEFIRIAGQHLAASGVENPRLDAEVLLGHVLGLERIQLYVQFDRPMMPGEVEAYRACIARRARREPVSYIVGRREFRSLELKVDRRVLIPRPETEHLVEEVLRELDSRFGDAAPLRVADIGTGSGAIAIALAIAHPGVSILGVDLDAGALQVAQENVGTHDLEGRITLIQGDLLEPLGGAKMHAIVSNPPYVRLAEWKELMPEVRDHEPELALVGGDDGLAVLRTLVSGAAAALLPHGFLALEIGSEQGDAVVAMAAEHGYAEVRVVKDLAGRDRVAVLARGG